MLFCHLKCHPSICSTGVKIETARYILKVVSSWRRSLQALSEPYYQAPDPCTYQYRSFVQKQQQQQQQQHQQQQQQHHHHHHHQQQQQQQQHQQHQQQQQQQHIVSTSDFSNHSCLVHQRHAKCSLVNFYCTPICGQ